LEKVKKYPKSWKNRKYWKHSKFWEDNNFEAQTTKFISFWCNSMKFKKYRPAEKSDYLKICKIYFSRFFRFLTIHPKKLKFSIHNFRISNISKNCYHQQKFLIYIVSQIFKISHFSFWFFEFFFCWIFNFFQKKFLKIFCSKISKISAYVLQVLILDSPQNFHEKFRNYNFEITLD